MEEDEHELNAASPYHAPPPLRPPPVVLASRVQAVRCGGLFGAIFTRNGLICLRPLPSITAASLGEKVGSGRRWHSA